MTEIESRNVYFVETNFLSMTEIKKDLELFEEMFEDILQLNVFLNLSEIEDSVSDAHRSESSLLY